MIAATLGMLALGGTATLGWVQPAPNLFAKSEARTVELAPVDPGFDWVEAVPSWNVRNAANARLTVEARVIYPERTTKYFSFGSWTQGAGMGARGSLKGQADEDGTVLTDTLRMKDRGGKLQVRLTGQAWPIGPEPVLERLFFNFTDGKPAADNAASSGTPRLVLDPPQYAQGDYPNGKVLCSPACLAMVLGFWAEKQRMPSLALGVSTVEAAVFDPIYNGAGNWSYNVALAGSAPGMVAYAARLGGVRELEEWIARGVPIVCSVSWYLLHGEAIQEDEQGHLVVLVGFQPNGDPVFNDPGKRGEVRKSYPRADFLRAWEHSKRTSYVIYPESVLPGLPGVRLEPIGLRSP